MFAHRPGRIALLSAAVLLILTLAPVRADDPPKPGAETQPGSEILSIPLEALEKAYAGSTPPEGVRMLLAISKGSMMGPNDGWFGPGQSRYSWQWLAERHGVEPDAAIPADKFSGPQPLFARLDRNRDGRITPDDLDWSDRNPWVQQASMITRLFRRMDRQGDGKLTREDFLEFFERAANGGDSLSSDDLRDALLGGVSSSFSPGDAPSKDVLIRGLFAGEIGSLNEGPKLNDSAPDFSLKTYDGKQTVRLSEVIGEEPVVLVFGNYTCGPFRALYPGVDAVYQRLKDHAIFLAVYVREAHPKDGWHMESNERLGVQTFQPKTYDERVEVANKCHELLKPSMPLLVDEIHDPTGHAYSGMPARLYIIDRAGKVAYKSGRGPFGFKAGEMEQALVMLLLDQAAPAAAGEEKD